MRFRLALLLTACQPNTAIDVACGSLCAAALTTMSDCLEQESQTWESSIYGDAEAFTDSCETWTWEMTTLARKQTRPTEALEELELFCVNEEQRIVDGDCEALWLTAWDTEPWLLP